MIKKLTLVFSLLVVLTTGCIGPMNAFNSILSWNTRATQSKWWNEVIFIPMSFVYPFLMAGDVLIFNSIYWWSGTNPIDPPKSDAPGTFGV